MLDDWDDGEFEVDDLLDHADLDDEEEEELEAELGDADVELDAWEGDDPETDDPEADDWEAGTWGPDEPTGQGLHDGVQEPVPGGASGVHAAPRGHADRGRGMSWSAWDVGTVFALGGWLLDQHAAQVGAQVHQALTEAGSARSVGGSLRGAPHPPPSSGHHYGVQAGALEVGGPLLPGLVYVETRAASGAGRGLLVQAEGTSPAGGRLVLVISVVPSSGGPRLWVVAEERPDGFSAVRLLPVFQRDPSGGLAIFATDDPRELADAVVWACGRENVAPELLDVVRRA
jgi:hypothetical protein